MMTQEEYQNSALDDKIYLNPGDVVTLRQDIPNKPIMLVVKKETSMFKHKEENKKNILKGIRCRWFTTTGELQETVFNTKDITLIK